jgi:hypothetical protein
MKVVTHRPAAHAASHASYALTIAGVPASKVGVSKAVSDAQATLYGGTWGGDMNTVTAFKMDPAKLGKAMGKPDAFKQLLWQTGLIATGNNVKDFTGSDNQWKNFTTSLKPVKDPAADLTAWLKSDSTSDADVQKMSGAIGEMSKFIKGSNEKVFHVSIGMEMPEDTVEALVGVDPKKGDVRMLTAYYAAG